MAIEIPYHVRRKLEQKEVEIVEGPDFSLRCTTCGATWTPETENRLRLPKDTGGAPRAATRRPARRRNPTG